MTMEIVKVSARSIPKSVAGAIAAILRDGKKAQVQAVGAGAINQAVKAIAIVRVFMEQSSMDVVCLPSFTEVELDGINRTAIEFIVEPR